MSKLYSNFRITISEQREGMYRAILTCVDRRDGHLHRFKIYHEDAGVATDRLIHNFKVWLGVMEHLELADAGYEQVPMDIMSGDA